VLVGAFRVDSIRKRNVFHGCPPWNFGPIAIWTYSSREAGGIKRIGDGWPPKQRTPIKSFKFFGGNMGFKPRGCCHWTSPESPCYVVVFMCPELRYGPGSNENRLWDTPSKKQIETMLGFCWRGNYRCLIFDHIQTDLYGCRTELDNTLVLCSFTSVSPQKNKLGHKTTPEDQFRDHIRCTRLQLALSVFFV